ncbi:hypothetical protein ACLMAJ_28605 [Nocardia sp. KC 131]|uniref:hypothetical protein n=1 Tax=Nocardia arseniciresistens TaxID=3392119 RepID=UPI00398E9DB0
MGKATLTLENLNGRPTLRMTEGQAIPLTIDIVDAQGQPVALYMAGTARANYLIESPRVTNWGSWGVWGECQPGEFAVGMKLKTEPEQGLGDDTALNAIKLLCAAPGSEKSAEIRPSSSGAWILPNCFDALKEPVSEPK